MTLIAVLLALLAAAPAVIAQEPGCPEGYLRKPAEDSGRPKFKRGPAGEAAEEKPAVECVAVEVPEAGGLSGFGARAPAGWDAVLARTRERLHAWWDRLPDLLCRQTTDRFRAGSRRQPRWKRQDRITAELIWFNGREGYRDLRRNGEPLKAASPVASGLWATGDYVTMVLDLFSPETGAFFEFLRGEPLRGRDTRVYAFSVEEAKSHWKLAFGGQTAYPAYTGKVWIDREAHDVLRAEFVASGLPFYYPEDSVEVAIDFAPVQLAGAGRLLAVKSDVLGCERGKDRCTRNVTVFEGYQIFHVESTVMQTDSTITFEDGRQP